MVSLPAESSDLFCPFCILVLYGELITSSAKLNKPPPPGTWEKITSPGGSPSGLLLYLYERMDTQNNSHFPELFIHLFSNITFFHIFDLRMPFLLLDKTREISTFKLLA